MSLVYLADTVAGGVDVVSHGLVAIACLLGGLLLRPAFDGKSNTAPVWIPVLDRMLNTAPRAGPPQPAGRQTAAVCIQTEPTPR